MNGPLLRTLRRARRISQTALAETARVPLRYLARLEGGLEANPPLLVLKRLAKELGVKVGELVG